MSKKIEYSMLFMWVVSLVAMMGSLFFFSCIGALIALYHYGMQKIPFLHDNAVACGRVPCTGEYINWFGFITIPFLSLTAFVLIFIASIFILKQVKKEEM